MVRRVVGRDHVDRAVAKAVDAGLPVRFLAQRRVHAAAAVVADHPFVRRADVVWRSLRRHADAARLRLAHKLHAAPRGDMAQVNPLALRLRNQNVAGDHHFLRRARRARQAELGGDKALVHHAVADEVLILAVAHNEQAEVIGVLHRQPEQVRIGDRLAVVGNRDDAGFLHPADLRHLHAGEPLGDRADRVNVHAAALRLGLLDDVARHRRVVVDRLGVGHAADRREAAVRRRARAGDDILFVFLTGVAQMAVHVDEARRDDLARRVVDLCLRIGQILADRRDFAIRNQNIRHLVHTVGRVNHTAAANQQLFHQTFSLLVSI